MMHSVGFMKPPMRTLICLLAAACWQVDSRSAARPRAIAAAEATAILRTVRVPGAATASVQAAATALVRVAAIVSVRAAVTVRAEVPRTAQAPVAVRSHSASTAGHGSSSHSTSASLGPAPTAAAARPSIPAAARATVPAPPGAIAAGTATLPARVTALARAIRLPLPSGNDDVAMATPSQRKSEPDSSAPGFTFDQAAARARKEEASKAKFTQFKESQLPPSPRPARSPGPLHRARSALSRARRRTASGRLRCRCPRVGLTGPSVYVPGRRHAFEPASADLQCFQSLLRRGPS